MNTRGYLMRYLMGVIVGVCFVMQPITTNADARDFSKINTQHYTKDELIVKYKRSKARIVSLDQTKTFQEKIEELASDPNVEYVEPNYLRNISMIVTNDTLRDLLWVLDNTGQEIVGGAGAVSGTVDADIDAPEAWTIRDGGDPVIVAVIDNGVEYTHPDLEHAMWDGTNCKSETGAALGGCNHGYDYENNDTTPLPSVGQSHGTHVAGIIGAVKNNAAGVIGVAPNAKIMAVRFALNVSTEIKAIDFAIQNGVKVINASFGGVGFSQAEYDAIERFKNAGGIFIAAAGNCGDGDTFMLNGCTSQNQSLYPASYDLPNIIAVAATDQHDNLADFSNHSETLVDVGAPGVNSLSTLSNNTYGYASGTSMAAPYTAGLAALVLGSPYDLSYTQVKDIILENGDTRGSLVGKTVSGKRINAQKSLFAVDILNAQLVYDTASEGLSDGQYSSESKALFQTAINTATLVKNTNESTDQAIADAVVALGVAQSAFLASQISIPTVTHTITASAGTGGVISPEGVTTITDGEQQVFTITAQSGYTLSDVLVDGVSVGSVTEYTFDIVTTDHTIEVVFTRNVNRSGGGGGGGGGGRSSSSGAQASIPTITTPQTLAPELDLSRPLLEQNTIPVVIPICSITTLLKVGSKGDQVKCLQTILKIPADGIFGPQTKLAVINFQRMHPLLVPDGVVGPKTVAVMK